MFHYGILHKQTGIFKVVSLQFLSSGLELAKTFMWAIDVRKLHGGLRRDSLAGNENPVIRAFCPGSRTQFYLLERGRCAASDSSMSEDPVLITTAGLLSFICLK